MPAVHVLFNTFIRISERVSERLLEGAVVRAPGWKFVPAEGPRGPATPNHCGATQGGRGDARRAWT